MFWYKWIASWLEELHKAEDHLTIALLQTQRVIDDYYSMAPSDGDFALDKALRLQHQAMDEYVAVCGRFRKFIIEGTLPDEPVNPSNQPPRVANHERGAKLKPLSQSGGSV
jgi:hypothetical protein